MPQPSSRNHLNNLSIGEVLNSLRGEFSDISISKIRFLEAEGLITPKRSSSGYRQFTADDINRLRYILRVQRDHYLPLKVIKDHLAAIDRGLEPPKIEQAVPEVPRISTNANERSKKAVRLTTEEVLAASGLEHKELIDLEKLGLIKKLADNRHFDEWALKIAKIAAALGEYGIEARHLRTFKSASDRELNLIQQVTTPFAKRNHPKAPEEALKMKFEIAQLTNLLQAALLNSSLEDEIL